MADSKDQRGPADRTRINVADDYELHYWSRYFRVTPDQLKAAVGRAGVMIRDIEAELVPRPRN